MIIVKTRNCLFLVWIYAKLCICVHVGLFWVNSVGAILCWRANGGVCPYGLPTLIHLMNSHDN